MLLFDQVRNSSLLAFSNLHNNHVKIIDISVEMENNNLSVNFVQFDIN